MGIKEWLHGLNSVHCCITISGIADAYLYKYRNTKDINDLNLSEQYAEQLHNIALSINSREQQRIAREILIDIARERGESLDMRRIKSKTGSTLSTEHISKTSKGTLAYTTTTSIEPPTSRCMNVTAAGASICKSSNKTNTTVKLLCAACHSISYCSRECQREHWPLQKLECRRAKV